MTDITGGGPGMGLRAVLFDLDGVLTDTASAHFVTWKALFDTFLSHRHPVATPFTQVDYREHVDGRPRHDGLRAFLVARGIELPEGDETDGPEAETLHGLGARKNRLFRDWLEGNRVEPFPGSVAFLREVRSAGLAVGVFSSSRNARPVLRNAELDAMADVIVDGEDMAALGLPGKPDPAIMLHTARALGIAPDAAAVVEDAIAGVQAGAAGKFAACIGVDRDGDGRALRQMGATITVADLAELRLDAGQVAVRTLATTPHVMDEAENLRARLRGHRSALFLDYDGVLSPIVAEPHMAVLGDGMRAALRRVAQHLPVAIVSGRDLDDVRGLVNEDALYFAGSHGFDLAGPDGWRMTIPVGEAFLPALAEAGDDLDAALAAVPGARVERKRFALAIHYRAVAEADEPRLARIVAEVMEDHPSLRWSGGKKVFDVKPRTDWHKGRAVQMLLRTLDLEGDEILPVYIGDDTTDEDAFRVLAADGLGIVVIENEDRPTSARLSLGNTDEAEQFLCWLADLSAEGAP